MKPTSILLFLLTINRFFFSEMRERFEGSYEQAIIPFYADCAVFDVSFLESYMHKLKGAFGGNVYRVHLDPGMFLFLLK